MNCNDTALQMAWTRTSFLHRKPDGAVLDPHRSTCCSPLSLYVFFLLTLLFLLTLWDVPLCVSVHHLPSLQPPPTPLALPPALQLSKYLDMFRRGIHLISQVTIPPYITQQILLITLHTIHIIYWNATAKTDKVIWLTWQHCVELARILTFGYLLLLWWVCINI